MLADTKQPSADGAAHPPISGWDATDHLSAGEVAMADKIRYDPLSKKWTNRPRPARTDRFECASRRRRRRGCVQPHVRSSTTHGVQGD